MTGNLLFVMQHELAHAAITEMGLPVLGRPEDAANSFAAVGLIRIGSEFTHQVLTEAARGWFLADRRDVTVAFYDEHGLNQQRAYQIVCLMVGADEEKFKDLAAITKLPKERQESCAGDYSNAAYSWDLVLKPHVRTPDQPETKIDVVYGEAKGSLVHVAEAMRSIRLLEAVAVRSAEAFAWPKPLTFEMKTCGYADGFWNPSNRRLTVCYEFAAQFADLYLKYGQRYAMEPSSANKPSSSILHKRKLGSGPPFKNVPPKDRQELAEFVTGNLLFVILHELAHAAVTEMGLPVLGRPEDAADFFAAVGLIKIGFTFTHKVLTEAAMGWFLADRRDKDTDDTVAFYDEHGLNQQRAYQIVCFMVGADEEKFKDLADRTKLPKARQESCAGDYSKADYSWNVVLKPHVRTPDQPETEITVAYGDAKGRLAEVAEALKSIGILEAVAVHSAEAFAWPAPFKLELQTCGFSNARWDLPSHTLTVCYELAADFAELYRAYGKTIVKDGDTATKSKKRTSK